MTNKTTSHSNKEITKNTKGKLDPCENHLFRFKEEGKTRK